MTAKFPRMLRFARPRGHTVACLAIGALVVTACTNPETRESGGEQTATTAATIQSSNAAAVGEQPGSRSDTVDADTASEEFAAVPILESFAARLDSDAAVLAISVTDVATTDGDHPFGADLTVGVTGVLLESPIADQVAALVGETGTVFLSDLFRAGVDELGSWEVPTDAVAIITLNGEAIGVAQLAEDGNVVLPAKTSGDALILANLARELREHPLPTEPTDACSETPPPLEAPENDRAALVLALNSLDAYTALRTAQVNDQQVRIAAEAVAQSAPEVYDDVTGDRLVPDDNDIATQLIAGIDENDIVIRRTVPVGIDATDLSADVIASNQVIIFSDATTGELLGWTTGVPPTVTEAAVDDKGDPVDEITRTVEHYDVQILAPAATNPVEIRIVAPDDLPACEADLATLPPDVVVPYNDLAGERRAEIILSTSEYRDFVGLGG